MSEFEIAGMEQAGAAAPAAPAVDDYGEDPRRPVDEKEELDDTLQPRSPQRIAYLLEIYEAGRPDLTEGRIQSDKARYRNAHPAKPYLPAAVSRNPQANIVG